MRPENLAIYPASSVHGHQPDRTIVMFLVHTTKKIAHEFIVYEKTDDIHFLRRHKLGVANQWKDVLTKVNVG